MVPRRTNFGERSEPAPDRGGKLQSAGGGAARSNVSPLYLHINTCTLILAHYYCECGGAHQHKLFRAICPTA